MSTIISKALNMNDLGTVPFLVQQFREFEVGSDVAHEIRTLRRPKPVGIVQYSHIGHAGYPTIGTIHGIIIQ